jgi:dolichol-phosphate mannosyltransferase
MRDVFDTYELLAYLPIRAARLGHTCAEVPVTRAYPPAGAIPTKIHGRGAQLELVKILGRAAIGRYDPEPACG